MGGCTEFYEFSFSLSDGRSGGYVRVLGIVVNPPLWTHGIGGDDMGKKEAHRHSQCVLPLDRTLRYDELC